MPDVSLEDALNLFDPGQPLENGQLDTYYVERPHAPLEPLKRYLEARREPVKVLFSGHRGSGKSTELRRLARDLAGRFFVVTASARSLNPADLQYVDVIFACAAALLREATAEGKPVAVPDGLLKDVEQFLRSEIITEVSTVAPKGGSVSAKFNAFIFSAEGKYGRETQTRTTVRERLFSHVSDLIDKVNAVCDAVREGTGRPPLLIFEDVDKTDLKTARTLFFDHATTLTSLACHIIYTFPIPLCYSNEFTERMGDWDQRFLLPNVGAYHQDDTPDASGRDALRQVITKRVPESLFEQGALDQIIELSGGLLRNLVRLVSDAALIALTENAPRITTAMVEQVAAEIGNDYRRLLLPEHYAALREAHQTKQITPNETVRQLLENLSLLEYRNAVAWCDVHPVVQQLLTLPSSPVS